VASTGRCLWVALPLLFTGAVGCGKLEDTRPAEWSFIYATIIQPQCATVNCHSAIAKKAEIDLSERDVAYCSDARLKIPGVLKMDTMRSRRMPPDAPLPAADIGLIAAWQAAGGDNDKFAADERCPSPDVSAGDAAALP
jgi:hypothetical protein